MRGGLAGLLSEEVKHQPRTFLDATEITGEDFLSKVVPKASSIQILVENKHLSNFVSLTAPESESAGELFKWNNDFAWSYDGEVTDAIKARVKAAGGRVDAKFRVSLAWHNYDDLDLHVETPGGYICFTNKFDPISRGQLDVDMNVSASTRSAVENVLLE